jgi:uncharacterized protein
MANNNSLLSLYGKSPIYQLFVSLLIVLGVGILLFSFFLLAGMLIFNTGLGALAIPSSDVGAKDVAFLRYILISQHISFFIIPAIIILIKLNPGYRLSLKNIKTPGLNEIVFVIILAFCLFPINNFAGLINSGMHFPDWLSGVEKWMIDKESDASRLTDILMTQGTFWAMLFNLLLIAVIPAIGEELIFRGVFQTILKDFFKSGHLAIWVTAFVFSVLHFQFFGFIPRFILGLIFGYLFFWSGTIWLPVISHFVNNAVSVIAAYIQGWYNVNPSAEIPFLQQIIGLILPIIISFVILSYFRNKSKRIPENKNQAQFKNS